MENPEIYWPPPFKDIHFTPQGQRISALAEQLGIKHLVHIVGFVPDADMRYLYSQAIALIMASYIGPTNMPIWEAFVAGCPVISSNVGAMPEQVGDAGLLFDPSDASELARRILELYDSPDLRLELSKRGKVRVEPFKAENRARELLNFINEATTTL